MAEEAEDDIGADILATMSQLGGSDDTGGGAAADEGLSAEPAADEGGESDGRVRDEHGRFAKKEGGETDPLANPTEKVEINAQPQGVAEPPEPATTQPPHSLKATLKAQWAQLSPEVQAELVRMEGVALQAKNEWQPKGEKLNRYEALIAPHRERLQLNGVDEHTYVQNLIAADEYLRRDPVAALSEIGRLYGVDLSALVGQRQQGGQGTQNPQLPQNQTDLQRQVDSLVQQALSQRAEAEAQERNNADIQAFRADPNNMFFDNVKGDMAAILQAGQASTLKDAYEKACRMNDEVWALIQADRAKPTPVQQKAQPASRQVTGAPSPGGTQARTGALNGSIEGDVAEAWEQVQGGRL